MVDVVSPHTMPSETEVHVARSFLTKILRSSMRRSRFKGKNDPVSRPHSWHSSKLTEEDLEPAAKDATSAPVWKPKHEARLKESSSQDDQNNKHQLTSHLSSAKTMERLECPPHPYPPERISPTKYTSSPEPPCGPGGKRDPGISCLSSSSPPGLETSCRKGTSSENIFFKGIQSEGSTLGERSRYLQPMLGNGGWEGARVEEQPTSRVSGGLRPNIGPVWQVPEKKKSQSPPPPLPPLRSDSFAATKVFPYSEVPTKSHGRSVEQLEENNEQNGLRNHQEKTSESRRSFNLLPTKDLLHPSTAADHNHNQLHPNKHFSLSSNDIRQSHFVHQPAHQRQYSDESSLYLQTRSAPSSKSQSVGSYYRSLQDLPTNASSRKQVRQSTASVVTSSGNPNFENGGHNRYYGLGGKHMSHTSEHQAKAEVCRGETEKPLWLNSNESGFPISFKTNLKAKYSLPQSQVPYGENKEHNGHSHLGNGVHYDPQTSELSARTRSPEDGTKRGEGQSNDTKWHFPTHQNNDHKVSLQRHQDPWVPQEDHRITPLKTPLLHCLAQESRTLADRQSAAITSGLMSTHETCDSMASSSGKVNRRSDRYATTLRNEIQQKRAQLQKSRSAATLTCDADEEELEEWRSTETSTSSGVPFSNTYKDHLKEAQARVLQATSFQRRDLEPFGPDTQVAKSSSGRVRGRKRFPLAKRTHSFSEPDKIDKVGVEGDHQTGSFGERRKLFEAKPAFSKPVSKSSQGEIDKIKDRSPSGDHEEAQPSVAPGLLSPGHKQVPLDQQRLGTFAEYQATWNKQKKSSEAKTQGRYHSAENILDADAEDKAVCIHERSRSSPSADFYTLNNSSPWRDQVQQSSYTSRGRLQPDHRPRPDAANPSHSAAPPVLNPGSQPPQTRALPPPPRPHLGPETTSSSSQEFLSGAQPLSSSGSDTQHHASVQSPAPDGGMSGPDVSRGDSEPEDEKQQAPLSTWTTTLAPPPSTGQPRSRSPSPQFAPLRLTDKPPAVATQEEAPPRSDHVSNGMDGNSPLRKVPVRIIHAETSSNRTYLPQNPEARAESPPPSAVPSLGATERSASSPFSAYARQRGAEGTAPSGLTQSEDDKREELARDIMGKDKSLVDILDQSGRKTTMDLMEGLFPPEEQILEGAQQRRRTSAGSRPPPPPSPRTSNRPDKDDVSATTATSLVPSSSYYNTSAPKAELLMKMKDMQEQLEEQDSEDELDVDLASKKQQLISSLARKLAVLREARQSLQEDVEDNEALGRHVDATVQRRCRPNQLDKFRMFVGDLDKVVSLLLSLSGRLARVENALDSLEDEAPPLEKRTLIEKRKLLMRQHEDAKELKENLDRREHLVSGIMETHLDAESLEDYRHFVKMKSALIIEQRKLEDKIKLGEEQLKCLVDSLPLHQRPPI